jgi:hypothetical protein
MFHVKIDSAPQGASVYIDTKDSRATVHPARQGSRASSAGFATRKPLVATSFGFDCLTSLAPRPSPQR